MYEWYISKIWSLSKYTRGYMLKNMYTSPIGILGYNCIIEPNNYGWYGVQNMSHNTILPVDYKIKYIT